VLEWLLAEENGTALEANPVAHSPGRSPSGAGPPGPRSRG
jgi:hypothetical protein